MAKEKSLQEKIAGIINKYDPIGLLKMGSPSDEYNGEAEKILQRINQCKSVGETQGMIYRVFVRSFEYGSKYPKGKSRRIDPGGAGKREDYRQMAEEIYSLARGKHS